MTAGQEIKPMPHWWKASALITKPTRLSENLVLDNIPGLSLLVLFYAISGLSPGTLVFPSHQKPTSGLISCDSVQLVVSSISKATVLG